MTYSLLPFVVNVDFGDVKFFVFHPIDPYIIISNGTHHIINNYLNQNKSDEFFVTSDEVNSIKFSPDGKICIIVHMNGLIEERFFNSMNSIKEIHRIDNFSVVFDNVCVEFIDNEHFQLILHFRSKKRIAYYYNSQNKTFKKFDEAGVRNFQFYYYKKANCFIALSLSGVLRFFHLHNFKTEEKIDTNKILRVEGHRCDDPTGGFDICNDFAMIAYENGLIAMFSLISGNLICTYEIERRNNKDTFIVCLKCMSIPHYPIEKRFLMLMLDNFGYLTSLICDGQKFIQDTYFFPEGMLELTLNNINENNEILISPLAPFFVSNVDTQAKIISYTQQLSPYRILEVEQQVHSYNSQGLEQKEKYLLNNCVLFINKRYLYSYNQINQKCSRICSIPSVLDIVINSFLLLKEEEPVILFNGLEFGSKSPINCVLYLFTKNVEIANHFDVVSFKKNMFVVLNKNSQVYVTSNIDIPADPINLSGIFLYKLFKAHPATSHVCLAEGFDRQLERTCLYHILDSGVGLQCLELNNETILTVKHFYGKSFQPQISDYIGVLTTKRIIIMSPTFKVFEDYSLNTCLGPVSTSIQWLGPVLYFTDLANLYYIVPRPLNARMRQTGKIQSLFRPGVSLLCLGWDRCIFTTLGTIEKMFIRSFEPIVSNVVLSVLAENREDIFRKLVLERHTVDELSVLSPMILSYISDFGLYAEAKYLLDISTFKDEMDSMTKFIIGLRGGDTSLFEQIDQTSLISRFKKELAFICWQTGFINEAFHYFVALNDFSYAYSIAVENKSIEAYQYLINYDINLVKDKQAKKELEMIKMVLPNLLRKENIEIYHVPEVVFENHVNVLNFDKIRAQRIDTMDIKTFKGEKIVPINRPSEYELNYENGSNLSKEYFNSKPGTPQILENINVEQLPEWLMITTSNSPKKVTHESEAQRLLREDRMSRGSSSQKFKFTVKKNASSDGSLSPKPEFDDEPTKTNKPITLSKISSNKSKKKSISLPLTIGKNKYKSPNKNSKESDKLTVSSPDSSSSSSSSYDTGSLILTPTPYQENRSLSGLSPKTDKQEQRQIESVNPISIVSDTEAGNFANHIMHLVSNNDFEEAQSFGLTKIRLMPLTLPSKIMGSYLFYLKIRHIPNNQRNLSLMIQFGLLKLKLDHRKRTLQTTLSYLKENGHKVYFSMFLDLYKDGFGEVDDFIQQIESVPFTKDNNERLRCICGGNFQRYSKLGALKSQLICQKCKEEFCVLYDTLQQNENSIKCVRCDNHYFSDVCPCCGFDN
eukprot:TRINITY_DN612_c0_g1_i1.p1 TRINITY_DN612_c0_g1~~TRINITY_DN612_c0_g1_i1.p1  ORF type:complete len:1271 (+),score=314.07 TRINITY_DN612_c0_g1_i1:47-3859(+)